MKYIETERLILREWTFDDINDQVEGLSNFETAKNLTIPFPYNAQNSFDYISKHLKNNENSYAFAVELKETNKVIGGASLEFRNGKYSGGIWLNEKFTGKGYGTEVWIARAMFAFDVLRLDELENGYFEFNERSKHLHEKVGYKIIGKTTNFCPALNSEVVEVRVKLTKMDFYNAMRDEKLHKVYEKVKLKDTNSGRFHL